MIFIIAFSTLLSLLYFLLILVLYSALGKKPATEKVAGNNLSRLSLLIPFRNEEAHLPDLFKDIENLNYPENLLEVILIDDHSHDGSLEIAGRFADTSRYKIVVVQNSGQGKKTAIANGIDQASSNTIIQTDADCRFGKQWLRRMLTELDEDTLLICGAVKMNPAAGTWGGFAALEYMSLQAVSAAFVKLNKPILASAANLLFRKSIWNANNVNATRFSGDDTFLVQKAARQGKVTFVTDPDAQVETFGPSSLGSLVNQRARWGGKSPAYPSLTARLLSLMIAIYNLNLLVLLFLSLLEPRFLIVLLLCIGIKALSDWPFLNRYAAMTKQKLLMPHFVKAIFLYPVYINLTLAKILFGQISWKDRKLRPLVD